jgi:hypothetical protein
MPGAPVRTVLNAPFNAVFYIFNLPHYTSIPEISGVVIDEDTGLPLHNAEILMHCTYLQWNPDVFVPFGVLTKDTYQKVYTGLDKFYYTKTNSNGEFCISQNSMLHFYWSVPKVLDYSGFTLHCQLKDYDGLSQEIKIANNSNNFHFDLEMGKTKSPRYTINNIDHMYHCKFEDKWLKMNKGKGECEQFVKSKGKYPLPKLIIVKNMPGYL